MRPDELKALARESLKETDKDFGYYPGFRAAQAKGTICRGTFTAEAAAEALTKAIHFQASAETKVTVRFSNAATNPMQPDTAADVRGIAIAFHLPNGKQTDIIGVRMSRFFVGTARQFLTWQRAMRRPRRSHQPRPRLMRTSIDIIRGRLPWRFLWWQITALKRVPSYANCFYNSLHAYKWVDGGGKHRYVRYWFVPEAGDKTLNRWQTRGRDPDYLRAELAERLAHGPVRFQLEVQIAEDGDRVDDATVKWPSSRQRVQVGTLVVTELAGWDADKGPLTFDPTRVTEGIELPVGDDLLALRRYIYAMSARRRTGSDTSADNETATAADNCKKVHLNGIDICYDRRGPAGGRPLLLMMGFACPQTWWTPEFCKMLTERGFEVIRYDHRDCGRSSRIDVKVNRLMGLLFPRRVAPYTVDDMADDAAGLLTKLGVPAAHVMGISMGGMVAQALAIKHPARVLSMTCIASTPAFRIGLGRRYPKLRVLYRLGKRPPKAQAKYVKFALPLWRLLNGSHFPFEEQHVRGLLNKSWEWSGGVDPRADFRQVLAVRAAPDRTDGLRGLRKPVTVIHGSADPLVRLPGGFDTWKAITGAKLAVVTGMGHYTPIPTWETVVDAVDQNAWEAYRR